MKPTRFLIFDLDGTLIDSSEGVVESVNYSLRMMNQPEQPPEKIKSFIGFPLSHMYPVFTDVSLDELYSHFRVKADEVVVASAVMLDGVRDTLELLRADGYRMAIATTKVRRNIDGIMDRFGWHDVFEVTVGGDEVARQKPEPDAFIQALERLGADPEQALVVGDTVNDILAAQAVPMRIAAVTSPYGGLEEIRALRPNFMIDSIRELPSILESGKDFKEEAI